MCMVPGSSLNVAVFQGTGILVVLISAFSFLKSIVIYKNINTSVKLPE